MITPLWCLERIIFLFKIQFVCRSVCQQISAERRNQFWCDFTKRLLTNCDTDSDPIHIREFGSRVKVTDNLKWNKICRHLLMNKIARPQGSQSFTVYTISKEQYDSWEWFFMKRWYNQSDQHARIWLASLARVLRFALTKIFEKKSVSQSTRNALKRIEMQKKKLPLWSITRFARSAKPERRSAMKF